MRLRLVDADKLKELIVFENNDVMATRKLVTALFEDIEMVKAIPIEWIVNWLEKKNVHYCDIDLMLEDWEKENEHNKESTPQTD